MEILPLEMALSQYSQWYSEIKLNNQEDQLYCKYLEGRSTLEYKNGNHYEGELKGGFLNGKGTFRWSNGLVYQGEFRDNLMNGVGKITWTDGSYYEGEVMDNKKHGQGTYYSKQDNSTYFGDWIDGERTGNGRIEFSNGSIYEGEFHLGNKEGTGRMTYLSGNSFEGKWKSNVKQGEGTMNWFSTNEKYMGNWSNNKQNGRGVHIWIDNSSEHKLFRNRYDGEWRDCRRQGFGSFYYHNGTKYDGNWKNNQRSGFGILTEESGSLKIGFFKEDRLIKEHPDLNASSILPESFNMSSLDTSVLNQSNILNQSLINHTVNQSLNQSIINQSMMSGTSHKTKLKPLKTTGKRQLPQMRQASTILPNRHQLSQFCNKNQVAQNLYSKIIDVQGLTVTEPFQNYLLRQHSFIKQWYKMFTLSHNEYYSGMMLSDFIRIFKELKMIEGNCTIPAINRLFSKGNKSLIDLNSNTSKLVQFIENHQELHKIKHLNQTEIRFHAQQLYDSTIDPELDELRVQNSPFSLENLQLLPDRNIHDGSCIILFRHFINLLLIMGHLKYPQQSIQTSTPKIFQAITSFSCVKGKELSLNNKPVCSSGKLSFSNSFRSSLPIMKSSVEWAKQYNLRLFHRLTESQVSLIGVIDKTTTVAKLFTLLQKQVLKETIQKYVFFEKVERYCDVKHYYFKKEYKLRAEYILSHLWRSEIFKPLLNYELICSQFCDLLEMTLLKKLSSNAKDADELKMKYIEIVNKMLQAVDQRDNVAKSESKLKLKEVVSEKSRIREQKIREAQAERMRLEQEARKREEEQREMFERECMGVNDCNIMSNAYLEESEDEFD